MCFLICSCCNFCNSYSSKCIEYTILVISSLSFAISLFGFFYINQEYITLMIFIVQITLIIFSFSILICIIFIIIWRYKQTINTKRNTIGEIFAVIGIVTTIFYLILIVSFVNLCYSNYQRINYPCSSLERNEEDIKSKSSTDDISYTPTFEENKYEFCIQNPDYHINKVPIKDYIFAYIFSATLGNFYFLLIYFWFNEFRRIKFGVDGPLNEFNVQEVNNKFNNNNENENENSNERRVNERIRKKDAQYNNKNLYKIYGQQEYGIRYDIYGRPIFTLNKVNTQKEKDKDKPNITNIPTQRFSKRKSMLNNRVTIYKNKNIIKQDSSNYNSSDRPVINKFQFSNTRRKSTSNNVLKIKNFE